MSQDSENWHYILNFVKKNGMHLLSHLVIFLFEGRGLERPALTSLTVVVKTEYLGTFEQ